HGAADFRNDARGRLGRADRFRGLAQPGTTEERRERMMFLIPTELVVINSNDQGNGKIPCTFDAESVILYSPEMGHTRLLFQGGTTLLIAYDYDELMKFLIEHGDTEIDEHFGPGGAIGEA